MSAIPRSFTLLGTGTGTAGPSSGGSTDNAIVRWDGTGGRTLQNSVVIVTDNGDLTLPSTATAGLQLYNTVEQVTNYERLELLWSSNIATIRTAIGGSGNRRSVRVASVTDGASITMFPSGNTLAFNLNLQTSQSVASLTHTRLDGTLTQTSGTNTILAIQPTYNQASGTAANTDLLINRTQTAVGSGAQLLADFQVGGVSQAKIFNTGRSYFASGPETYMVTNGGTVNTTTFGVGAGNGGQGRWAIDFNAGGTEVAFNGLVNNNASNVIRTTAVITTSVRTTGSETGTLVFLTKPAGGAVTAALTLSDTQSATFAGALITTPQALSGAGAVNLTTTTTHYTSTGVAEALTLANGTAGQTKIIVHVVDGGSGVLTPTTALGYTTITFTNAGESAELEYTSIGWAIRSLRGAVAA